MDGRTLTGPNAPVLADLLRFVPFFATLPAEGRDCLELLKYGRIETRASGDLLTAAGAEPDLVFVLSGTARASRPSRVFHVGDYYGEIDLLLGRPAFSDVRAAGEALLYRLGAATFGDLLASCHLIVRQMLRGFAVEKDRLCSKEIRNEA